MFWKKKNRMIDVRELQKRGIIRIPKENIDIATDKDGFVKIDSSGSLSQRLGKNNSASIIKSKPASFPVSVNSTSESSSDSSPNFFGFLDSTPSSSSSGFSAEADGYSRREVDAKMEELDNKIYKLEQRIELLERKSGVGSGW